MANTKDNYTSMEKKRCSYNRPASQTKHSAWIQAPDEDIEQVREAIRDMKGVGSWPKFFASEFGLQLLQGLSMRGMSQRSICEMIGAPTNAFARLGEYEPDVSEALAQGQLLSLMRVENALFRRAIGFEYEETSEETGIDAEGREWSKEKTTTKFVPPDTQAALAFLYNRAPERWKANHPENNDNTKDIEKVKSVLVALRKAAETGAEQEAVLPDD